MNYNKPIYAELVTENPKEVEKFKAYLTEHGIDFKESADDLMHKHNIHIFEMSMTKDQLLAANAATDALFYQ